MDSHVFIRKVIAVLQIFGGISGLVLVANEARSERLMDTLVLGLVVATLYLLALVGGMLLWRRAKAGIRISIFIQLVQLLKIQAAQYVFAMSFGFDLSPMIWATPGPSGYGVGLVVKVGGTHTVYLGNPGIPFGVGFSLVSLCFLVSLLLSDAQQSKKGPE